MASEAQGRRGPGCGRQGGQLVGGQPPAPRFLAKLQEPPDTFFSGSPNSHPPPPPAWEGGAGPTREEGGQPRTGQRLELLLPEAARASPTTWPQGVLLGRVVLQLPSAT